MAVLKLDELNVLKSEDFETYFSKMNISAIAKEKRIALAEQLEDVILEFLESLDYAIEHGVTNISYALDNFTEGFRMLLGSYMVVDSVLLSYISSLALDIENSTQKKKNDKYTLSEDRARFIAENEANTFLNAADYSEAKGRGFRHKTWHTMNDRAVRKTHKEVEGVTIDIDGFFQVGKAMLRYPKDYENGWMYPEETINCRCSVTYSA